jgi:hypothetical protein
MPVLGNLAWAPMPSFDGVEVFDRFNEVPTFGIIRAGAGTHLFWRAFGYVTDHVSLWLYVPMLQGDEESLADCDGEDLLRGSVYDSPVARYVTLGVAWDNRIIFEREWLLPAGLDDMQFKKQVLRFVVEAMQIKMEQGFPA